MSLGAKAKQKMLRMETDAMFPYLIKLNYVKDDGTEEISYYVNGDSDVNYIDPDTGENVVYRACYFTLTPPEKTNDDIGDAKITISAIDNEWISKIRSTQKQSKIKFIAVIIYDENREQVIEPIETMNFTLTKAQWTQSTIQWTMKFDDMMDISVPLEVVDSRICPAIA